MLDPTALIQWMDVAVQEVFSGTVMDFYSKYAVKAVDGKISFLPDQDIVKITDLYGWTDVLSITKIENIDEWILIHAGINVKGFPNRIHMTKESLIPTWDSDISKKGFHGEIIYRFDTKKIEDLLLGDTLRIIKPGDPHTSQFSTVNKLAYDNLIYTHGYEIETKSEFFNANNIYLTGGKINVN